MPEPKWLEIARTYEGTREVVGKGSNPRIMQMAKNFKGWVRSFFTDDDIPWCALFVGSCLVEAGHPSTNSLAARSYETYGIALSEPRLGCIAVFVRKGGGHVGFYLGERKSDGAIRVYGGNQNNSVNATWIAADRLSAYRWPGDTVPAPEGRILLASNGESLSTNEA